MLTWVRAGRAEFMNSNTMQGTGGSRGWGRSWGRSGSWHRSWRWSWARSGGRGGAFQSEGFCIRAELRTSARRAVQRAPLVLIVRNTLALRVSYARLLACLKTHHLCIQLHLAVVDVANPIETGLPPLKNSCGSD